MIAANFSRTELDSAQPPNVTSFSLVDDASGIELFTAPPYEYCNSDGCFISSSFSAYLDSYAPTVVWGNWSQVAVGLTPGDPNPGISMAPGGFVTGDYLSPADVALFAANQSTLGAYFTNGQFADTNGNVSYGGNGSIYVTFDGAVSGSLSVTDASVNNWNINFDGTANSGVLDLNVAASSTFLANGGSAGQESAVTGTIQASFIGSGAGTASPVVDGVIGGVNVSTDGANSPTPKAESLQGIFEMAVNAG